GLSRWSKWKTSSLTRNSRRSRCSPCSKQTESGPPDTATSTRSPGANISCRRAVAVTRSRTRATAGGWRGIDRRLGGRAREPLVRVRDLGSRREVRLGLPRAVESFHPGALHHRGDEPLTGVVLTDLPVEADHPLEPALERRRPASLLQPAAHPVGFLHVHRAEPIHPVGGGTFQSRHQPL